MKATRTRRVLSSKAATYLCYEPSPSYIVESPAAVDIFTRRVLAAEAGHDDRRALETAACHVDGHLEPPGVSGGPVIVPVDGVSLSAAQLALVALHTASLAPIVVAFEKANAVAGVLVPLTSRWARDKTPSEEQPTRWARSVRAGEGGHGAGTRARSGARPALLPERGQHARFTLPFLAAPPPYCCPYRLPYCSFTSFWLARRRARGGRLDLS